MIELLRDPAWNGIAGIAAIIALIIAVWQEKRVAKFMPRTLIVMGRAIIGILIIFPGPSIQWSFMKLFEGGIPLVIKYWQSLALYYGLNKYAMVSMAFAVFPGTVTAVFASTKNKNYILRANIAAIISLSITDIVIIIVNNWGVTFTFSIAPFLQSVFYNIWGGLIAGTIIAYCVNMYDKAFKPV